VLDVQKGPIAVTRPIDQNGLERSFEYEHRRNVLFTFGGLVGLGLITAAVITLRFIDADQPQLAHTLIMSVVGAGGTMLGGAGLVGLLSGQSDPKKSN
jgi:hypothetical protein